MGHINIYSIQINSRNLQDTGIQITTDADFRYSTG